MLRVAMVRISGSDVGVQDATDVSGTPCVGGVNAQEDTGALVGEGECVVDG